MFAHETDIALLSQRLHCHDGPLCAAIDGAIFTEASDRLAESNLVSQALYSNSQTRADVPTGPHLVILQSKAEVARLLALDGIERAAVFWGLQKHPPITQAQTFAHLRSLTMVQTPLHADGNRGKADTAETETLLFRFADPNVMARAFPCLTPAQRLRVFGAANALIFFAPYAGGVRHYFAEAVGDPADRRILRLTQAQYDKIIDGYRETLVARALHRFAPQLKAHNTNPKARILAAFERAESYGLSEQATIFEFISCDIALGAQFEKQPRFAAVQEVLQQADLDGELKVLLMNTELDYVFAGKQPW